MLKHYRSLIVKPDRDCVDRLAVCGKSDRKRRDVVPAENRGTDRRKRIRGMKARLVSKAAGRPTTPAMAAGVAEYVWSLTQIAELLEPVTVGRS